MLSVRKSSSFAIQFLKFLYINEGLSNNFTPQIPLIFIKELYYWLFFSNRKIVTYHSFWAIRDLRLSVSNSLHTVEIYLISVLSQHSVDVAKVGFFQQFIVHFENSF